MDREQAQELFSAYREGELPADQGAAFEALLKADEQVRADYSLFCRALESLELLRREPAPEDFVEKVQGRMRRRSGGKLFAARRGAFWTRVPYEFFSLILILIILAVYYLTLPVVRLSEERGQPSSPPASSSPEEPPSGTPR
jgi:anti-sigma factor RsiW